MFKGNGTTGNTRSTDMNSPDKLNRIVDGTEIKGDIKSDSNIRIDGRLIGSINTKGRVVIGQTGYIEGEIICQNADIEGTLKGKITVDQTLSLKSTSKLTGDILTNKLAIEPGADFSGSCQMGSNQKTNIPASRSNGQVHNDRSGKGKESIPTKETV